MKLAERLAQDKTDADEIRERTRRNVAAMRKRRKSSGLCPDCGNPLQKGKAHCAECIEKANERHRANYKFYKDLGLCIRCKGDKPFCGCRENVRKKRVLKVRDEALEEAAKRCEVIAKDCDKTNIACHKLDAESIRSLKSRP